MSLRLRNLPPAGHPIRLKTILASFLMSRGNESRLESLFMDRQAFWLNSGTGALAFSLKGIAAGRRRREVILPAYTCPSVLASVLASGLTPVLCDLEPDSFNMDLNCLEGKIGPDTLAIIAVHLFGIPENVAAITNLTTQDDIVFIEDATQAFGNRFQGKESTGYNGESHTLDLGTCGDVGVYSFGRGKPLSVLGGGVVIVNNPEFAGGFNDQYRSIPMCDTSPGTFVYLMNLMAYSVFFHPSFFWIPQSIPWLKLGETVFISEVKVTKLNSYAFRLADRILPSFQSIRERRNGLAELYLRTLGELREEFIFLPQPKNESTILLRFPLILKSKEKRDLILIELMAKGLGATGMYPVPLNEQSGVPGHLFSRSDFPNAKHHSGRIVTLPLHEYVNEKDVNEICGIIAKHLNPSRTRRKEHESFCPSQS